jgi:uncharacterized protein YgiM (DUF1202 family)
MYGIGDFRTGQRHDGYIKVKEYSIVAAKPNSSERTTFVIKGVVALVLAVATSSIQYSMYFSENEPKIETPSQPQQTFGLVKATHGLNLRKTASSSGQVLASIPANSSVEIISQDGPEETIGSRTANWMQVRFNEQSGWVWGGFIEVQISSE